MRRYLLLLLLLLPLPGKTQPAARPTGSLTVVSEDGDAFCLVLNGQCADSKPRTSVRVNGLTQPFCTVRILFADSLLPALSMTRLPVAGADGALKDVTYQIKTDRKGLRRLVFASAFAPVGSASVPPPAPPPGNGYQNGPGGMPPPDPSGRCRYAMKPADFTASLRTVEKISFDETRLSTARSILSSNCVTTDQVVALCGCFSFEANKLDFAKIAYGRVVDPNNYFKVANVFKFDSSKRELSRFLSGY